MTRRRIGIPSLLALLVAIGLFAARIVAPEPAAAQETCGAKCISLPYDGGRCVKPRHPRQPIHECSKGHKW